MRENIFKKGAIVVPLWSNSIYADIRIVAQPKDVAVRRFRVNTMSAIKLASTPELAGVALLISAKDSLTLKDQETTACHFTLQSFQYLV
jgi:hypothetical protein